MGKKIALAFLVVCLILGGIGLYVYQHIYSSNFDVGKGRSEAYVYVPTGADFEEVMAILIDSGFVIDEAGFRATAELKKYTEYVKAGRFKLETGMTNNEAINSLRSQNIPVDVTFNNISTFSKLAGVLSTQLEPDSATFMQAFTNSDLRSKYGFEEASYSAMFIPNTYEMYWNRRAEDFIERMAKEFRTAWNSERKSKAKAMGLSQSEVSTLASIVEAETKEIDEMPKVAGLYLNRLDIGMRLQADPTVKYALNDPTIKRIYEVDLKVESPYNTYLYAGLRPGPIAFPSIRAIDAVLNAKEHGYLYMCARPDYSGYHNFAKTLRQHNQNGAKYHAFLRKEGIR